MPEKIMTISRSGIELDKYSSSVTFLMLSFILLIISLYVLGTASAHKKWNQKKQAYAWKLKKETEKQGQTNQSSDQSKVVGFHFGYPELPESAGITFIAFIVSLAVVIIWIIVQVKLQFPTAFSGSYIDQEGVTRTAFFADFWDLLSTYPQRLIPGFILASVFPLAASLLIFAQFATRERVPEAETGGFSRSQAIIGIFFTLIQVLGSLAALVMFWDWMFEGG